MFHTAKVFWNLDILCSCVLDEYEELRGTAAEEKMTAADTEHEQAAKIVERQSVNQVVGI